MTMADTIAVMHDGRLEQLGSPVELYERPRTEFVASFLGQSNLLTGRWEGRDGDHLVLRVGDTPLRVPAALADDQSGDGRIGVRPEKIQLVRAGEEPAERLNRLAATVTDASFLGVSVQYLVTTAAGDELTVHTQNVGTGGQLVPGEQVTLTWDPDHTFVVA